jgi:hypothetical protein
VHSDIIAIGELLSSGRSTIEIAGAKRHWQNDFTRNFHFESRFRLAQVPRALQRHLGGLFLNAESCSVSSP